MIDGCSFRVRARLGTCGRLCVCREGGASKDWFRVFGVMSDVT